MNKNTIAKLKGEAFLNQKDEKYFSVRILSSAGNMTSEQLLQIAELAKKYGRGYVGFTTRLCVEIPWVKEEDINNFKEELAAYGLKAGGTGKRVRPLVACKGTVCKHGIIDTQKLCNELHDKYFAMELPSKFKIGIVGCPNNCAKASLNDLGIMGQVIPNYNKEKCVSCGICTKVCREGALTKIDDEIIFNKEKCVNCGACIKQCRLGALTAEEQGVKIFIGGRFGRGYKLGESLDGIYSVEEAKVLCEKIINYYKENGNSGERFSKMIDRIGIEKVKSELI